MAKSTNPFRYFDSSPEVIRTVVMMYVKYPLSLRNVEDLLAERGIDICHETVRLWWNRFGPMFAEEIRRKRVQKMRAYARWRWRLDEIYVKINGETHHLWRAVDHEGEVLEPLASKTRDNATSSAERRTRPNARPPWPSGRRSPRRLRAPCPRCASWKQVSVGLTARAPTTSSRTPIAYPGRAKGRAW